MSYHDDAPDTIENCQKGSRTRSRRVVYSFNITHAGNQTAIEASPANTHEEYTWPESYPPSREITPVPPPRLQKIRKRMVVKDFLADTPALIRARTRFNKRFTHWIDYELGEHRVKELNTWPVSVHTSGVAVVLQLRRGLQALGIALKCLLQRLQVRFIGVLELLAAASRLDQLVQCQRGHKIFRD